METIVGVIYNTGRDRRVLVGKLGGRSFGFSEEFYCDEDGYHCWLPQTLPDSRFDSVEIILRELAYQVPWTAQGRMEPPGGAESCRTSW